MIKLQVNRIDTFGGHQGPLYAMALNSSTKKLYTAGSDGLIVEWDLEKPDLGKVIARAEQSIYSMLIDSKTNSLYIGLNLKGFLKINLSNFETQLLADFNEFWLYDFAMKNDLFWFAHHDGLVSAYSVEKREIIKKLKIDNYRIRKIGFYQEYILLANSHGELIFMDLFGKILQKQSIHDSTIFDFFILDDIIFTVGKDAKIQSFRINQDLELDLIQSVIGHIYAIHTLAFHPAKKIFATGSMDKTIKIWDLNLNLLKVIDAARHGGHKNSVNKLIWSELNNYLFSISDDKLVSIWEIQLNEN